MEKDVKRTNLSSFHLNHHSWMLPCSSKSFEIGQREKKPSKSSCSVCKKKNACDAY